MTGIIDGISNLFGQATGSGLVELAQIRDRFTSNRPLYQTRVALGSDASDLLTGKPVILWTSRTTVPPVSQEAAQLIQHFRRITEAGLRTPKILGYGIDRRGVAFYFTERTAATSVLEVLNRPKRPAHYMLQILRQLAKLHEAGIALGTISDDSFLLDEDQKILINGLFPSSGMAVPQNNLAASVTCVAPELFQSAKFTQSADVFSIAAYFYKLLSKRDFPTTLTIQQQYEHLRGAIPVICKDSWGAIEWLKPILEKCFNWKPENRYRSGVDLLKAFSDVCPEAARNSKTTATKSLDSKAANLLLSKNAQLGTLGLIVIIAVFTTYMQGSRNRQQAPVKTSMQTSINQLKDTATKSNLKQSPAGISTQSSSSGSWRGTDTSTIDIKSTWALINQEINPSATEGTQIIKDRSTLWGDLSSQENLSTGKGTSERHQRSNDSNNFDTYSGEWLTRVNRQSEPNPSGGGQAKNRKSRLSNQNSKHTFAENLAETPWWRQKDSALVSLIERGSIYLIADKPSAKK